MPQISAKSLRILVMNAVIKEPSQSQPTSPNNPANTLRNHLYDDLQVGQQDSMQRTLRAEDIQLFALASGDFNPAHLDPDYAAKTPFKAVIAHGMWGGALISAVLGTRFPGPGTIYLSQSLRFSAPVYIGDTITVTLTVKEKHDAKRRVTMDCQCTNQDGQVVISGEALVIPPAQPMEWAPRNIPQVQLLSTNS